MRSARKLTGIVAVVILCFFSTIIATAGTLPSYTELCNRLVNINGWQAEDCDGMNMSGSGMSMVSSTRTYTSGDKRVEVVVACGTATAGYWAPFQSGITVESKEQVVKTEEIDSYRVGIAFEKQNNSGSIVILLDKGGETPMKPILVGSFENMHWEDALEFLKQFDWDDLAKAFK
ncbi:MAG: hypothetical protein JRI45_01030 [Deltaproteobacteria bacterium]|nr:hypothetical protein [Deltaproteobacteria bacterium]MBW2067488.1 hypothetical protein [Deltaproteobacteria bacterium]